MDNTIDTLMMFDFKVHALNILRALYKDSRLGEVVTPFVADGLMAAILGFQSPFWAVSLFCILITISLKVIFKISAGKYSPLICIHPFHSCCQGVNLRFDKFKRIFNKLC